MKEIIKKLIRACEDSFLDEHKLDPVDINIVDNYTDYVIEMLDIAFEKMKENK